MQSIKGLSLTIKDPEIRRQFLLANNQKVFRTGIALIILRCLIIVFIYVLQDQLNSSISNTGRLQAYIQTSASCVLQIISIAIFPYFDKKSRINEYIIPAIMCMTYVAIDPSAKQISLLTYLYGTINYSNMWCIHLITSNLNWMVTATAYTVCSSYFMILFICRSMQMERFFYKTIFLILIGLIHIVYIWLAYHTDQQRKINFCQTYALKAQKENLLDILGFFPESLMIVREKEGDTKDIMYQNNQMKDFQKSAEKTFYDSQSQGYKQENMETDGENVLEGLFNPARDDDIFQSNQKEQQSQCLWDNILDKTFNYDRISILNGINSNEVHLIEDSQSSVQSFEFKQTSVFFDSFLCRLIILRDISDLVKGEYIKSVEKLSEIMIASTSHDMRTPLNTIVNMLKLIQEGITDSVVQHWIRIANNSSSLLLFLVNDTLDYFQIKSGKFSKQEKEFNFKELAEDTFELITVQMEQKNLTKIIEIDDQLESQTFLGDKQRLSQVIVNLLSNSLKFTFEGYIKLKFALVSDVQQPQFYSFVNNNQTPKRMNSKGSCDQQVQQIRHPRTAKIQIAVEDSGVGVKDEDLPKLFKIFGKIPSSSAINTQGIGLGLTICNKILNEFGSELQIKSQYKLGSEFFFVLELPQCNQAEQSFEEVTLRNSIISDTTNRSQFKNFKMQGLCFMSNPFGDHMINSQVGNNELPSQPIDDEFSSLNSSRTLITINEGIQDHNLFGIRDENQSQIQVQSASLRNQNSCSYSQEESKHDLIMPISCTCPSVLIVDDNNFNIFSLKTLIELKFKLQTEEAYHGEQAVELVKKRFNSSCSNNCMRAFKIIFMDISMPIMDGYQATKMIREIESQNQQRPSTIIGLSAHSTGIYKTQAFAVGMNQFMMKPVELEQLLISLQSANLI